MTSELRNSGISVVGDVPWGTHFCHFYETKQDLLDTLVPYFKSGLESNECCLWVVSDAQLITVEEAKRALAQVVPDLDRQLSEGNIEILSGHQWYYEENALNLERVKSAWDANLKRALAQGYDGLRASADTFWLAEKDLQDFCHYEKQVEAWVTDQRMTVLCTYPLTNSRATELLDVVQAHQFAIARRQGQWQVIETPQLIQAKAEITRLNEELEQRVTERTTELRAANEALRKEIAERNLAEDALRRSEDHLRLVIDTIPTMAWSLRPDAVLDFVNQRWLDYTGLSFEAAIEDETRTVHPEDLSRVMEKWRLAKDTSELYEDEMRLQRADGEYRWFLVRIAPLLDEQGNLLKRYGVAIDIEERKQAEDDLRQQKEILQQIFDHIPVMLSFVDADGHLQLVNREWERTLGWSLQEIRQQNLDIFVECYPDPEYRQQVLNFVADAKGEWADFKTRVRDGRVIDTTFVRIQMSDGTTIGIGQDITERKRAEALLYAKEQEFRAIVENAPDQIIRYDREFRRAYVNPAVATAYGLPREALIGKPIGSVIEDAGLDVNQDEIAHLRQRIADVFNTGQSSEYELDWPLPTGRRCFSVRLFPELDLNGSVTNVLGISRDITERKQAESALDERFRFETLVTELSAAFANLTTSEVDREIHTWLKRLVEFLGVDRASFLQFAEDWTMLYRSHSYTVPGIEPLPPPPFALKDQFPWISDQLRRGITVKWERAPEDIPDEAVKEKEYAARMGVKSGLSIPVRMGGSVICAISFTSITSYRDWPDSMLARLRLVGEIFAAAVERKRAEEEIKREKEILEKIFENIPVMIGFVGENGRVKLVNREWERSIGWTLEELQEQNVDIFAEAYPDLSYRQEVLDFVAASTGEWVDIKIKVRDGRVIDAACAVIRLSDGTRVAIAQDITERKQAEDTLKRSETQLAEAQRLAHIGSWDWDLRTNAVIWSEELYNIFGIQPGTIRVAGQVDRFIHPDDLDLGWDTVRRAVASKEPYDYYHRILRPDGTERIVRSRGSIVSDERDEPIRVFGATQDVTELKRAEEQLKTTSEQLRALSARLQMAKEEEATRIARELHDELGSTLTSLKWNLELLEDNVLVLAQADRHLKLRGRIKDMAALIDATIQSVRRISSELRPAILDDLGLIAALQSYLAEFQERSGISTRFQSSADDIVLTTAQSTALFRIFQEGLTNVLRHAGATEIEVTISQNNDEFLLALSDNGRGITESEKTSPQSLGLLGMEERTRLIGGEIKITEKAQGGTIIRVRVPIMRNNGVARG